MRYELKNSFKYGLKGVDTEAEFIEVSAPTGTIESDLLVIDKALAKVSKEASDNVTEDTKKDDDVEMEAKQFYFAIAQSDVNLEKIFKSFRKILSKTALIDNEVPLSDNLYNKMDFNETKNLLGWYIKHFLFIFLQD